MGIRKEISQSNGSAGENCDDTTEEEGKWLCLDEHKVGASNAILSLP